jgi:hypothetical protein
MATTILAAVSAMIAAPVTPAARRRAAITWTVVPVSRAWAAVISAFPANDHTGLNDRRAIPIAGLVARRTGLVAWRICGVRGIAARRVGGCAVRINGATGEKSGRSDDQTCSCKFHDGERSID